MSGILAESGSVAELVKRLFTRGCWSNVSPDYRHQQLVRLGLTASDTCKQDRAVVRWLRT
jgi:hypothetical protein